MNMIKLLFKFYKALKNVDDSGEIVIRLSKSDSKYKINRMYTEDK